MRLHWGDPVFGPLDFQVVSQQFIVYGYLAFSYNVWRAGVNCLCPIRHYECCLELPLLVFVFKFSLLNILVC